EPARRLRGRARSVRREGRPEAQRRRGASGRSSRRAWPGPERRSPHVETPILVDLRVQLPRGSSCRHRHGLVTAAILSRPGFDARTVDPATVQLGRAEEIHRNKHGVIRHLEDVDRDGDLDLVLHFDFDDTGLDCDDDRTPLTGRTFDGQRIVHDGYARFGRDFAMAQDWSLTEGLSFWFYGTG